MSWSLASQYLSQSWGALRALQVFKCSASMMTSWSQRQHKGLLQMPMRWRCFLRPSCPVNKLIMLIRWLLIRYLPTITSSLLVGKRIPAPQSRCLRPTHGFPWGRYFRPVCGIGAKPSTWATDSGLLNSYVNVKINKRGYRKYEIHTVHFISQIWLTRYKLHPELRTFVLVSVICIITLHAIAI